MLKHMTVIVAGIIAILYLLNIGVGIIELIPDNVPFVGNLDEGGAALVLIMCLRYFGMDVSRLFEREKP
ncbi:MAG: DUF1232 domain-containing protein [Candidatus Latescibacteria bacterium]|jgi:hypothetical protein|nr:DUF1232 domain-containing protein [Candidatus Latescibacterota bacterium]